MKPAAQRWGLEFETKEAIAEGDKDFSAILSKVKQEGPDAIFLGTQINETANIVNQMAQSGYSSEVDVLISGGSYSDQLLELIGDNGDGMYITMSYFISEEDTRGIGIPGKIPGTKRRPFSECDDRRYV